jgi:protein-S-isoprenylcysteine O-methyltransferase Ste14
MALIPYSLQLYTHSRRGRNKKFFILAVTGIVLIMSYFVLYNQMLGNMDIDEPQIEHWRKDVLMAMGIISYLYLAHELLASLWQRINSEEAATVATTYGLYYLGFTFLGYDQSIPLGAYDFSAITLFAAGIIIAFIANAQRAAFYNRRENHGMVFTGGIYQYSRYINYFGEVIWLTGYALLVQRWEALIIPAIVFIIYTFYNIPRLDKIQTKKYGKDFQKYKTVSKKLVPFVY